MPGKSFAACAAYDFFVLKEEQIPCRTVYLFSNRADRLNCIKFDLPVFYHLKN